MYKNKLFIQTNVNFFTGERGQVACPSVMKQRQVQIPQRRGPCSSSGRTRVQEPCFGPTQLTRYPRSKQSSRGNRNNRHSCTVLSSLCSHLNICRYRVTSPKFPFSFWNVYMSKNWVLSFYTTSAFILKHVVYSCKYVFIWPKVWPSCCY